MVLEDRPLVQLTEKEIATNRLISRLKINTANYTNLTFTPEEVARISRYMSCLSTGSVAAIPLTCLAARCPFADACVFQQLDKAPVGQSCIVEIQLLQLWREAYILEYDIDPDSLTELTFINELAEIELMLYRLNLNLAKAQNAELVQDEVVAIDREGNVLTKRAISTFMEMKERLMFRKTRVVKLMVGDRQEKYKKDAALKIRNEADASLQGANLRRELQALIASASEANAQLPAVTAPRPLTTRVATPSSSLGQEQTKSITPEDLISTLQEKK